MPSQIMSLYHQLTTSQKNVLTYIERNPNCIQKDIVIFIGSHANTERSLYKLQALHFIKTAKGKGMRKHYSLDKRRSR